jgi:carbon-monoxide dehydrogenase large subunit
VLDPDLSVSGFDTGTFSSRGTFHMGNAIILAARDLKEQLLDTASTLLQTEKTDLLLDEGGIKVRGSAEKFILLAQAVRGPAVPRGSLTGRGVFQTKGGFNTENGQGVVSFYWMSAAGGAEVEVDKEMGTVKVIKCAGVVDVGKAINPASIVQQNMGSIVMALGQAFTERMIYDDKGVVLNPDFVDYKIPTVKDLPDQLIIDFLEVPHPKGPYGAKGIGEIMIVPTAAAVGNALYQATGVRFKTLPITPEAVLSRIREKEAAGSS